MPPKSKPKPRSNFSKQKPAGAPAELGPPPEIATSRPLRPTAASNSLSRTLGPPEIVSSRWNKMTPSLTGDRLLCNVPHSQCPPRNPSSMATTAPSPVPVATISKSEFPISITIFPRNPVATTSRIATWVGRRTAERSRSIDTSLRCRRRHEGYHRRRSRCRQEKENPRFSRKYNIF
ncbi:hypothetical protein TIFTF001_021322 [Ficus carica]|uniref:Uncharacterized protein n=1 Tax=Ficus carica TaxID=3494 RepID=A0AA88AYS1_FICCA|nr:hypothetical protein TIFTF001_021322 [Ficus carica]